MIFEIDEKSKDKINQWYEKHVPNCKYYDKTYGGIYTGAIGGGLSYIFTPTGLGTTIVVKCACGEKINLTNYDEW